MELFKQIRDESLTEAPEAYIEIQGTAPFLIATLTHDQAKYDGFLHQPKHNYTYIYIRQMYANVLILLLAHSYNVYLYIYKYTSYYITLHN